METKKEFNIDLSELYKDFTPDDSIDSLLPLVKQIANYYNIQFQSIYYLATSPDIGIISTNIPNDVIDEDDSIIAEKLRAKYIIRVFDGYELLTTFLL